jgi:hypothetical protein
MLGAEPRMGDGGNRRITYRPTDGYLRTLLEREGVKARGLTLTEKVMVQMLEGLGYEIGTESAFDKNQDEGTERSALDRDATAGLPLFGAGAPGDEDDQDD